MTLEEMPMRQLRELGLRPCQPPRLPPPGPAPLALVEGLVGAALPESYVAFLRFCNGCYPARGWFRIATPWGEREHSVAAFYSITTAAADTDDDSEVAWQYLHRDPDAPSGMLPIAMTPLGDGIYLDLTAEGQGCVLLAQHGLPAWASGSLPANTDLVLYVAPSFEAFVDMLTEPPDEE